MHSRRDTSSDEWGFLGDIAKIAIGVFIGCMASVFCYEQVLAYRLEQASKHAAMDLKALEDRQRSAEAARQAQIKAQQDQQRRKQLEQEWQLQQQQLAAKRKEQAWASYFQPSTICKMDPSRGDCADAHIRARKAFEAQYRDD